VTTDDADKIGYVFRWSEVDERFINTRQCITVKPDESPGEAFEREASVNSMLCKNEVCLIMTTDYADKIGYAGYTAWDMFDGNVMCGKIKGPGMTGWSVELDRVDGSWVVVAERRLRPATEKDIEAACAFYSL
jgi:hypothetical protein